MSTPRDLASATWQKSSYSNGEGGACVEIASGFSGVVPVRDSKTPERGALTVPNVGWTAFVDAVKDGTLHEL